MDKQQNTTICPFLLKYDSQYLQEHYLQNNDILSQLLYMNINYFLDYLLKVKEIKILFNSEQKTEQRYFLVMYKLAASRNELSVMVQRSSHTASDPESDNCPVFYPQLTYY